MNHCLNFIVLKNREIISKRTIEEIKIINEVLETKDLKEKRHIENATKHLFSENLKSYDESVTEICKAIEHMFQKILGVEKGTLGSLLSQIEKKQNIKIHEAYKGALRKLYGWASDAGARHSNQLFPNGATKEEAELFYFWSISFIRYIKNITNYSI